eukprot:g25094.t1
MAELEASIRHMKNGRAARIDEIPEEIFKLGGAWHIRQPHQVFWGKEEIPAKLKDAAITVFKKGQVLVYPSTKIKGEVLPNVEHFPNLGSYLSPKADIDLAIQDCIQT